MSRGVPSLCCPKVPLPQEFSPRERYQKPAPAAGTVESASDEPGEGVETELIDAAGTGRQRAQAAAQTS